MLTIPLVSGGDKCGCIIPGAFSVFPSFPPLIYLMTRRSGFPYTLQAGQTFGNAIEGRELTPACTHHALALS